MIGCHIGENISELIDSTKVVINHKGSLVQIFVNHMTDNSSYTKFNNFLIKHNIYCSVHLSYNINCSKNWSSYSWWINQCIREIELSSSIKNCFCVVLHLGKYLDLTIDQSINNMVDSLSFINSQIKSSCRSNLKILLETPSGQGTEIGYLLDDLSIIFNKLKKIDNNRFGLCIDTCHIFNAGYNIKNKKEIIKYLKYFDKKIGLKYVNLIHLNDSKNDVGSRVDRHDNFDTGKIGLSSILLFLSFFTKLNVPIVLETPEKNILSDLDQITASVLTIP